MDPKTTLGGSPTYVSVAAAKLGAKVSVISKVGSDFPKEYLTWLQNNNVDLSGLERVSNACTTRYVLEYRNLKRHLRLKTKAPPILATDIPRSLRSVVVHVAPIADEISDEVISKLRKSARILSLDPQGFVRSFDKKGNVGVKRWRNPEVLGQIDVFKSAIREIQAVTGLRNLKSAMKKIIDYGPRIAVVTRGIKGSTLLFENQFYCVPACKSKIVMDPTGAGDAYIGGLLAEYVRNKDIFWCACVGSAAASFVVEGIGPEGFGESHEVYERAQRIYEKAVGK
jgi:sugar/nucleoside kinase (ribokinase family)